MKKLYLLGLVLALGGCSTVTVTTADEQKLTTKPTYQERKNFFFWGLVNDHSVDAVAACEGEQPRQMQSQQTFTDGLLGVVTLGIYAPRSARIWCE